MRPLVSVVACLIVVLMASSGSSGFKLKILGKCLSPWTDTFEDNLATRLLNCANNSQGQNWSKTARSIICNDHGLCLGWSAYDNPQAAQMDPESSRIEVLTITNCGLIRNSVGVCLRVVPANPDTIASFTGNCNKTDPNQIWTLA